MGQMKIVTGPFSQGEWNSIVENFADLNLLQTWEYAEASSQTRALDVSRLLFEVDGNIVEKQRIAIFIARSREDRCSGVDHQRNALLFCRAINDFEFLDPVVVIIGK